MGQAQAIGKAKPKEEGAWEDEEDPTPWVRYTKWARRSDDDARNYTTSMDHRGRHMSPSEIRVVDPTEPGASMKMKRSPQRIMRVLKRGLSG